MRRPLVALLVVVLPVIAVVVVAAVADLPDELVVMWSGGMPTGMLPTTTATAVVAATGLVAVLAAGAVLLLPGGSFLGRRAAVSTAGVVTGAVAGMWGLLVVTVTAAPDPARPPVPDVELAVPLLAVLLTARLAGSAYGSPPRDPSPPAPAEGLPRAVLRAGSSPSWRYDAWSGFYLTGVGLLAVTGALLWRPFPAAAWLCWVLALATVLLVRMHVALDERGVAVWLWRLPAMVLPWADLVEARAARMRPLQWGGWGFRVIPARTGTVLARGPGLVVTMTDGRRLGFTMDDPVLPAGLVNAQLDRIRGERP